CARGRGYSYGYGHYFDYW
nr:immunoglobulin heavy chain junction region [Macaca mulatta]MOV39220.1 immunoglobulin heavy chain junction region [Macaca mulatta]MOV39278.1 immunoglobulin heavy chain junction region [Macaca mulatta]MOV39574.1 immunoglobulin heavy chain junction region [Macaca mulatta]MOV40073.1 immunoglobulin heavy chain junction region [Macaca mulatta]